MTNEQPLQKLLRWVMFGAALIATAVLVSYLNQPAMERLETAKRELSLAGYPRVQINRMQKPSNMVRCQVSQVRENRGFAYGWETDARTGVFCSPSDGRPTQILLD